MCPPSWQSRLTRGAAYCILSVTGHGCFEPDMSNGNGNKVPRGRNGRRMLLRSIIDYLDDDEVFRVLTALVRFLGRQQRLGPLARRVSAYLLDQPADPESQDPG